MTVFNSILKCHDDVAIGYMRNKLSVLVFCLSALGKDMSPDSGDEQRVRIDIVDTTDTEIEDDYRRKHPGKGCANFPDRKGCQVVVNREHFKPFGGKIFRKKGKGVKTGASHDWWSVYLSQYDWLKCSHMTKVVWLPNETDYSYCEFVAPKYSLFSVYKTSP